MALDRECENLTAPVLRGLRGDIRLLGSRSLGESSGFVHELSNNGLTELLTENKTASMPPARSEFQDLSTVQDGRTIRVE